MMATLALVIALAGLSLGLLATRRSHELRRDTLEKLHELHTQLHTLDGKVNTQANDWSAAFTNVNREWSTHIAQVEDTVATRLSFQHSKPKTRR